MVAELFRLIPFANLDLAFNVPDRGCWVHLVDSASELAFDKKCHLANRAVASINSVSHLAKIRGRTMTRSRTHIHPPGSSLTENHYVAQNATSQPRLVTIIRDITGLSRSNKLLSYDLSSYRRMLWWLRFAWILRLVIINCDNIVYASWRAIGQETVPIIFPTKV